MYSGSAPLILYSLPRMVTLTVFDSDPTEVLSRFRLPAAAHDRIAPAGPPDLGVYGFLQHRELGEHLLHPPRQRPTLFEKRVPLLFQRPDARLHVLRQMGVLAHGGLERPHLRPKLIALAFEPALLVAELPHQIGDDPDAILEHGQFLQDAAHARRTSPTAPRTSAPCFCPRAATIAAI